MTDSDILSDDVSAAALPSQDTSAASFSGDVGQLPLDTRRVFVQLLQGPAVDGRRQHKLWPILMRDEAVLRSRLHDLFLELIIDPDQLVAFTRQVVAESIDAPVLLRRATLTFLESALLIYLRQRLTHAEAQGERAVVSADEIVEHLLVYERGENVDHARFERQMQGAIEKGKKLSLLHKIRGGEDRFEVSPTLKLLFPAEEILALTKTFQALTANGLAAAAAGLQPDSFGANEEAPAVEPEDDEHDE